MLIFTELKRMTKTKQKIIDTSRILFNNLGFSHVTIRMIAIKLNMSSGNLNYHYNKREDILEALYFQMVISFDQRIDDLKEQTPTLRKMQEDIHFSMIRMVDYKFFWTDLHNILQVNQKITQHFNTVYEHRKKGLSYVFDKFIETNIMKEFEFEKEREYLIERMIAFGNTWLYSSTLYSKKDFTKLYITNQTNSFMFFLYPYLTDIGKDKFQKIMPLYFKN
jgi:AcrR family transcriptional regulator